MSSDITGYYPESEEDWIEVLRLKSDQNKRDLAQDAGPFIPLCLKCGCNLDSLLECERTVTMTQQQHKPTGDNEDIDKTLSIAPMHKVNSCSTNLVTRCKSPDLSCSITWEYISSKLVQHVGATRGIKLLQAANIPKGALSFTFYQGMLCNRKAESQQK